MSRRKLVIPREGFPRLTHYLFRFPAKFHPPVARVLLERYSTEGDIVLDPFCGSGTLLVEAAVAGRHAIGVDVDPVAIVASRVKTRRLRVSSVQDSARRLLERIAPFERPANEYKRRMFQDVPKSRYSKTVEDEGLWVPPIPNVFHWFRRYVLIDLARLHKAITLLSVPSTHRELLMLCFVSILRNASNADPVPVSGLEVTSHMRRRDEEGRLINPYALFRKSVQAGVSAIENYCSETAPSTDVRALHGNATKVDSLLGDKVDAIITSPPYHNAVDYYRRHTLEMYWLRSVSSHQDRLQLLPQYIGRRTIRQSEDLLTHDLDDLPLIQWWDRRLRKEESRRADAFKHYVLSMRQAFNSMSKALRPGAPAVVVVGKSSWNGLQIPTDRLFESIAGPRFSLADRLWYPLKNRYMSYARHNGASINREQVLVFCRRGA